MVHTQLSQFLLMNSNNFDTDMKKLILGLALIASVTCFSSCDYDDLELYSGPKAGLIIQQVYTTTLNGTPISYRDSTTYSFSTAPAQFTSASVRFVVSTMGSQTNYDRPYKMVIESAANTVEGVDYSIDRNDFTVNAGSSSDTVIVTLLRTQELRQKECFLKLSIQPNEHFEIPIEKYKSTASYSSPGDTLSATSFKIRYNEKYTQPNYWGWYGADYWGTWTVDKYLLLNEIMGWAVSDWSYAGSSGAKIALGKFDYSARLMRKYLQEKADNGEPVIDSATGTYMQLASTYKVDYSAYGSTN